MMPNTSIKVVSVFTLFNKISKIIHFYILLKLNKKLIPLCYFDGVPNVGDELNIKLISDISGRIAVKPPSLRYFNHLCAVGSVLSSMNRKSVVWGSGLISEEAINDVTQLGDIRAVRGYLTQEKIEQRFNIKLNIPLGDPALLIPLFITPSNVKKNYKFGLVLHYVDKHHPIKDLVVGMGGKIIDVGLSISDFVDEINECERILSSSMHGLILSDAYNIPNQRIILGDNIIGGDFKFKDYYSTTSQPDSQPLAFSKSVTTDDITTALSMSSIKHTTLDLDALLKAFPHDI